MKLSKVQQETLKKMKKGKWYTAYNLGVRMSTMEALLNKNLVELKTPLPVGHVWFPSTSLEFRLLKVK